MDHSDKRSTAGIRQFESTAIAKLVARGVPKHVATAFVRIGLPKSGRVDQIKDTVCKMEYKKFFVESTVADFRDPLRVGAYVPHIVESKETTFHCEFQMSDIESAKFAKLFPEFNVVARGRTYNQHAFYANKRYAETEVLMGMVYSDAKRYGFNPTSVIDLGGNDSWHAKRSRPHVHCDNPVLSARDKMRYEVRSVFSGSDRDTICNKKFSDCDFVADYAIGVHSTYDMTPKHIVHAMRKKGIKRFFGVINYIPDIESKSPGMYESDGLEMEIIKQSKGPSKFSCGFRHDPSLRYSHSVSTLKKYLHCQQQYTIVEPDGTPVVYTYSIKSVRGNSIVFAIDDIDRGVNINTSLWTQSNAKSYKVSIDFLGVKDMEVDCEFFDRIVLRAASAKNDSQFDIVSLFRYAKSLRQRVSVGGMVLSSGFNFNPDQLVNSTIAAYATAMAYRQERSSFFKEATNQIMHQRQGGFLKDVAVITFDVLKVVALAIPVAFANFSGLTALNEKIKQMMLTNSSVSIDVTKPRANKGMPFDPAMFSKRYVYTRLVSLRSGDAEVTPYSKYYSATLLPTRIRYHGVDTTFFSRGLVSYDDFELPKSAISSPVRDMGSQPLGPDRSIDDYRSTVYNKMLDIYPNIKGSDRQALVLPNGDRMYRLALTGMDGRKDMAPDFMGFVSNEVPFIIFRGVGRYAIRLKPPKRYGSSCVGFTLFFESRVDTDRLVGAKMLSAGLSTLSPDLDTKPETFSTPLFSATEDSAWNAVPRSVETDSTAFDVKAFSTESEGIAFVHEAASRGEYYMSGALSGDSPPTPPDAIDEFVRDAVVSDLGASITAPDGEDIVGPDDEVVDQGTVSSSDVIAGLDAMKEYVRVTDIVKSNALGGAKAVIDIARSAAQGDAPKAYFLSAASQLPGNLRAVDLSYDADGVSLVDHFSGETCEHMAVSDGFVVYDLLVDQPQPGLYVTSDSFLVFTGGAIAASVSEAQSISYDCPVTCLDGIAGSGKTYHIINTAKPGDVVLCETRFALQDTAADLHKIEGWRGHAYTVDAFLMHRHVSTCSVLWIDEAFRLHAGKIYALVKLLKPKAVYCFGDSKQIPSLSFVPGYDYEHHQYPFNKIVPKRDTWRFGADVCFALSQSDYYGYHAVTNVPVLRSFGGPVQFRQGMFHDRSNGSVLLTYTKTARDDLKHQGVKKVMTIGESQGKTFDHVVIFRDTTLNKALYYDRFQSLVAVTRHRRTCTYVTVSAVQVDDSAVSKLLAYVRLKSNEILLSSHIVGGKRAYADYEAYASRPVGLPDASSDDDLSLPPEVTSVADDWDLFSDDAE